MYSVTFAMTNFHDPINKHMRRLDVAIDTSGDFTVSTKTESSDWKDKPVVLKKTGLQDVKIPVGHKQRGEFWQVKISSELPFTLKSIKAKYTRTA